MQVNAINKNYSRESFSGILNNKLFINTCRGASENGALFTAGMSLLLTTFVRPISIMATPNVEKENKYYACAKSIASGLVNFGLMFLVTTPIVSAVKNIQKNPQKFLTDKTIKVLSNGKESLNNSKSYNFITQGIKLGSGLLTVLPKTILTCALIPPVVSLVFKKNEQQKQSNHQSKNITFKGYNVKLSFYQKFIDKISLGLSKVFNSDKMQNFSIKYNDTNLPQHLFSANDVLATGLFMHYTSKNKNIENNRKKTLICNAGIATGITIAGGYLVNMLIKKPSEILIQNFKNANKNLPDLEKCVSGIHNLKAAMILGGMYYIVTPVLATLLAEKMTNKRKVQP